MEEDFSIESNSESTSSDEMLSHDSFEDKSSRKRNHHSSSLRKSIKLSTTHAESNSQFPSPVPADALHLCTDESVIERILKIVNNPESMDGPEPYNDFNRNKYARSEENSGKIQLHIISNSISQPVSDQVLIWLVELRNLISHGLPNMSRSYITRLVFDPKHRNLVLVKENNVVGGICFRMFLTKNFSEIVFVVVSSSQHVRGYGTHMLNHLKDYHIKHNIYNLLTYAAVEAFGYFEKQGFSSRITLHESVYQGYINIYQHATLMECQLDKRITYTELSEVISRHKMIVKKLIEKYQMSSREPSNERNSIVSESNNKKLKKL